MSTIKMVEKARRIIMESGNFTMSVMTLWNNKNKDSFKLDPVTRRDYDSNKYQQGSNTVTTVDFRSSDYLAFEYKDWERKANMSVFASYPNMFNCKSFFQEVMSVLETTQIFGKNGELTAEGNEIFIQSEPLAGGKKLGAYFTVVNRNDSLVNCVTLVIGSDDCVADLDLNTFAGLADIVQSIDLLTQATLLMQMTLVTMGSGSAAPASSNGGGFNTSSTPRRQTSIGNNSGNRSGGGGLGLNRRQSPTLSGGSKVKTSSGQVIDTDTSNISDDEVPFTMSEDPKPVTRGKSLGSSRGTSVKSDNNTNILFDINAQMAAGESLDDLNLDGDEEGEITF